ncbi:MAG: glycosyltransferase family 4 protein [Candidatus Methanodesulfokora washburnensis]|jgi:glycosyltransferase involved in cell wall biosynthesis
MRVLIVGAHYPERGGVQLYSTYLSREFIKMGHEVEVLSYSGSSSCFGEVVHQLRTPKVKLIRGTSFIINASMWMKRKGRKFDLIIANYAKTAGAALGISSLKGIIVFHGTDIFMGRILKSIVRKSLSRGKTVSVSRYIAERVRSIFGVESTVIPGAVDRDEFLNIPERDVVRSEFGFSDEFLVLSAASLVPVKGVDLVVEVASRVDAQFAIAGDGPLRKFLEKKARKSGAKVRFLGNLDHKKLIPLMSASDVFLHMPRFEGYGLVIAEALAAGVPVVAANVGAIPEVLGRDGILVESVEEAVQAIGELKENREKLNSFRGIARDRVLSRSWRDVAEEFLKIV